MNAFVIVWDAVCAAGLVLSVRSLVALRANSPYTFAGWVCTAAYFVVAAVDATTRRKVPFGIDYILIAGLTVAFIVAGFRREPQAEPWWWPRRSSTD